MLLSGKATVFCKEIPLQNIKPGEFLNSIEWLMFQRYNARKLHRQFTVKFEEDSTYLRLCNDTLESLLAKDGLLKRSFLGLIYNDVIKKIHSTGDKFCQPEEDESDSPGKWRQDKRMKSLSVEDLQVAVCRELSPKREFAANKALR